MKLAEFSVTSHVVGNARIKRIDLSKIFEFYTDSILEQVVQTYPQRFSGSANTLILLLSVELKKGQAIKHVLVTLAGGQVRPQPAFSDIGALHIATASRFVTPENKIIWQEIYCEVSDKKIKQKIAKALRQAADGDLVVFVGDIAGTCDGRILPHLNLVPKKTIELPEYL